MQNNDEKENFSSFLILSNIETLQSFLQQIQENKIDGNDIIHLLSIQFFHFIKVTDKKPLISIFQDFLNEKKENDYTILQNLVIDKIYVYQKNKQFFQIFSIFPIFINHLFNQNRIHDHFIEKLPIQYQEQNDQDSTYIIKDLPNIGDFNSSFKLCVDKKCYFCYLKTYTDVSYNIIELENKIFHMNFTDEYPSFIVHSNTDYKQNKMKIPYFPFQTLKSFLNLVHKNPNNITFTSIDKFIIIKEIAIGMKQLHDHLICHQNLNNSSIMLSNNKDSYICNFAFDPNREQYQTKATSFNYRHPALIQNPQSIIINDEEIPQNYSYDIYSFGILMHEIITLIPPEDRFSNMPRQTRLNILTQNYKDFLFSQYKDADFDLIHDMKGARDIIEKCLNLENPYSSFKELISDLDNLEIYKNLRNQEEINYRIKNAADSNTYTCTINDLVINYYLGNEISKDFIISLFNKINSSNNLEESSYNDNDIISTIFNFFGCKSKFRDNYSQLLYEDAFNSIIHKNLIQPIKQNYFKLTQNQIKLLSLSISINENPNDDLTTNIDRIKQSVLTTDFKSNLIPITSLENYLKEYELGEMAPIFILIIVKEILTIHSCGLYHGEIKKESIGIYYNKETNMLYPLIIPFYFFYKNTKSQMEIIPNFNENIISLQQKDIKQIYKIIQDIDDSEIISSCILKSDSINMILFKTYNIIVNQQANQNFINKFIQFNNVNIYSNFQLSFTKIHEIFINYDQENEIYKTIIYFLLLKNEEGYLNLEQTITDIFNFIFIDICKQQISIDHNIDKIKKIETMLRKIKEFNDDNINAYINESNNTISTEKESQKTPSISKLKYIETNSFYSFKMHDFEPKLKNLHKKVVFRCIDIFKDLTKKSFEFIFKRYINNLHPRINYKVSVRIIHNDNTNIFLTDIIQIGGKNKLHGVNINGIIVFEIRRSS